MNHVMLIHAGALGDFVLAQRVVAVLRRAGAGRVTLLGRPSIAALAVGRGGVDAVVNIETGGFHLLAAREGVISDWVRERLDGVDLAVNMLPGGMRPDRLREAGVRRVIELDPRPLPGDGRHVTEQWLAHLATAGLDVAVGPPRLERSPDDLAAARMEWTRFLPGSKSSPVVIHPGSGGRRKCWPLDRFLTLARRLRASRQDVAFFLGPVEVERMDRADLDLLRHEFPCIEDPALSRVAALLATANLFIGNDSGVAHLSAAVGTSTVAVFGPTDPRVWAPLGPRVRVVSPPSGDDDWPEVDSVFAAISAIAEI